MLCRQRRFWLGKMSHSKFHYSETNPVCALYVNNRKHWLSKGNVFMHPSLTTRIYNVKRMRYKVKKKHSVKINQQASKETYQTALYRQSSINQPNGTALWIQQEPSHNHCSFEFLPAVTLTRLCLSSRWGLQEIIWIICRKQISHFAIQTSA